MKSGRSIKFCAVSAVTVVAIFCSFILSGTTFALRVNYGGKTIATVKDKKAFNTAVTLVKRSVSGADVENTVKKPVFKKALVFPQAIDNSETLANAIIENTDDIVLAHALEVNGERLACIKEDKLSVLLETRRTQFDVENANSVSEFVDSVNIVDGYYLSTDINTVEAASEVINSLQVRTVYEETIETAIPFETEKKKTSSQVKGYKKVITDGVNGSKKITNKVTCINGEETERIETENAVVAEPVNEVVEIGTARNNVSARNRRIAEESGFVFPVPKSSGWRVSAYYGDGRNHKGVDIACHRGTALYAVKGGRVVEAGWQRAHGMSSYGNIVTIDHGNGIKTRYAHEDSVCVSVGDYVEAGQQIGTVGRTGNATGNHVHFEVIVNGVQVNPAPYIGL